MNIIKSKKEIETINAGLLVFSATWCGPCKMMAPVLEQLENDKDLVGVSFIKVDISDSPALTDELGVRSVPTVAYIKNGKIVHMASGVISKQILKQNIQQLIK